MGDLKLPHLAMRAVRVCVEESEDSLLARTDTCLEGAHV